MSSTKRAASTRIAKVVLVDKDASRAKEVGRLPYKPTSFKIKALRRAIREVKRERKEQEVSASP